MHLKSGDSYRQFFLQTYKKNKVRYSNNFNRSMLGWFMPNLVKICLMDLEEIMFEANYRQTKVGAWRDARHWTKTNHKSLQ